ncbi:MAG: hypothetical protein IT495_16465 [Gammaproteobacteria bacterium]|nr:hypothetical protein [Gammaproteobacteria bacterium]
MTFPYYDRLDQRQQAIYRASDAVTRIEVNDAAALATGVHALETALASEARAGVQAAAQALADGLLDRLGVAQVGVKVLAVRPSRGWGELHGLYEREPGQRALISVWMRTARNKRVVAFRTFLRTFLHEICHHLDYEHLRLVDSYHTEGFFKRESSLVRQLIGAPARVARTQIQPAEPDPRLSARRAAEALAQCRRVLGRDPPAPERDDR